MASAEGKAWTYFALETSPSRASFVGVCVAGDSVARKDVIIVMSFLLTSKPARAVYAVLFAIVGCIGHAEAALADPALPGVARIGIVQGDVSVIRGDGEPDAAAYPNAPLLEGDTLASGGDGRAEIGINPREIFRLGTDSEALFASLDLDRARIRLVTGTLEESIIAGGAPHPPEIETPSVVARPLSHGQYRFSVGQDGRTSITVRNGRLDLELPDGDLTIAPGMTVVVSGRLSSPSLTYAPKSPSDDFDAFVRERDNRITADIANAEDAASIEGADELSDYGNWQPDSEYGRVWVPNVPVGWAPYHDGRWAWENGYGWTWVGYEPWGWAPYHYGRWAYRPSYGWAWCPPAPGGAASLWSPALVGFISIGGGYTSFGDGVGWVPLAPGDSFHPWWGARRYLLSRGGTVVYRNYSAPHAFIAVNRADFAAGRIDRPLLLEHGGILRARAIGEAPSIAPSPSGLRFGLRAAPVVHVVPQAIVTRRFVGSTTQVRRVDYRSRIAEPAIASPRRARFTENTEPTNVPTGIPRDQQAPIHAGNRPVPTVSEPGRRNSRVDVIDGNSQTRNLLNHTHQPNAGPSNSISTPTINSNATSIVHYRVVQPSIHRSNESRVEERSPQASPRSLTPYVDSSRAPSHVHRVYPATVQPYGALHVPSVPNAHEAPHAHQVSPESAEHSVRAEESVRGTERK